MTTPMSDEKLAGLRKRLQWQQRVHGNQAAHEANLAIEALIAERDAALKCVEAADKIVATFEPAIADAMAEGQRRATAAIVADLRGEFQADDAGGGDLAHWLATRYERGDHITKAKKSDTPTT